MKKKTLTMVIGIFMVFGLVGCGNSVEDTNNYPDSSYSESESKNENNPNDIKKLKMEVGTVNVSTYRDEDKKRDIKTLNKDYLKSKNTLEDMYKSFSSDDFDVYDNVVESSTNKSYYYNLSNKKDSESSDGQELYLSANVFIDDDEDIENLDDIAAIHYFMEVSSKDDSTLAFPKKDFEKFASKFTDIDVNLDNIDKEITRLRTESQDEIINSGTNGVRVACYKNDNVDIEIKANNTKISCSVSISYTPLK